MVYDKKIYGIISIVVDDFVPNMQILRLHDFLFYHYIMKIWYNVNAYLEVKYYGNDMFKQSKK